MDPQRNPEGPRATGEERALSRRADAADPAAHAFLRVEQSSPEEKKIKLSIELTPELNRVIERIAAHTGATKSEAVRKAIVLMDVAVEAKARGERLFVATQPPMGSSREIIGL